MSRVMGAVLAGGASRRMGRPKEGILLSDNRPMLLHVLDALRNATDGVAVVGICAGMAIEDRPDLIHLLDESPGEGPLAGLVTLLASGLAEGYLMAACDQPFLTPGILSRLLKGDPRQLCFFRAPDGKALDPFPGYYPATLLPDAHAAFNAGQRSLRRFLAGRDPDWIRLTAPEMPHLRDVDTPADLTGMGAPSAPLAKHA